MTDRPLMRLHPQRCRNCDGIPQEPHTCPYLMDVCEGEPGCDGVCTCCKACERGCADDI